jgi:hypothetical protein
VAGGPHLRRKYNVLNLIVSRENNEGAPLLAIFEKWGAGQRASEWVNGWLRYLRGEGAHGGDVMGLIQAFAAEKPHFSKIARSGAPLSMLCATF